MKYLAIALLILGILGMAVYLIIHNHPYWGGLFIVIASTVTYTERQVE